MTNPYMIAYADIQRGIYSLTCIIVQNTMTVTDPECDIGRKQAIIAYCNALTLYHCELCLTGNGRMLTEFNPSTIIFNVQGNIIEV